MKINQVISILVFLFLTSCDKELNEQNTFPYKAKVIGSNLDCGIFSIRFTSDLNDVETVTGESTIEGIYIAKNLPEELQLPGLDICLDIRKIQNTEIGVCKTMGPSYPWLYVTRARKE